MPAIAPPPTERLLPRLSSKVFGPFRVPASALALESIRGRPEPGRIPTGLALVCAVACGFFCFYGITAGNLYRTEAHRAMAAGEILEGGSWIVPSLYHRVFLSKPPGVYLAIAAASAPFGRVTELSARLPSAVAATLVLAAVYWITARHFGRSAGMLTALVTGASWAWVDKATSADIEMMLVAWVVGSLVFFFRGYEEPAGRAWPWWLASYVCVGGGFLTKAGPAVLYFYAAVIPFLWIQKDLSSLVRRWEHLVGLGLWLVLGGGWALVAVRQVGWAVAWGQIVRDEVPRVLGGPGGQAWNVVGTLGHPLVVLGLALPWSVFAVAAAVPAVRSVWDERQRRYVVFWLSFLVANLVVWSLLPPLGRRPRYMYPLLPSITCLAGVVWHAWLSGRLPAVWDRRQGRAAAIALGASLLAGAGALVYASLVMPPYRVVTIVLGVGAVLAGVVGWRAYFRLADSRRRASGPEGQSDLIPGASSRGGRLSRLRARLGFTDRGLVFAGLMGVWIVVKLAHTHILIPERDFTRPLAAYGRAIGAHLPAGEALHVLARWDPAMLFYVDRPIFQLDTAGDLADAARPKYCLLSKDELRQARKMQDLSVEAIRQFEGHTGQPMHLARVGRRKS